MKQALFTVETVQAAANVNLIAQLQTQTVGLIGETHKLPVHVPYKANADAGVADNSVPTVADNLRHGNVQNQKTRNPVATPPPWRSINCGKLQPKSRSLGLMPHNVASLNIPGGPRFYQSGAIANPADYTS